MTDFPLEPRKGLLTDYDRGRLKSRPGLFYQPKPPGVPKLKPGLHTLGLGRNRDGFIHIPHSHRKDTVSPLIVMLHGAGGDAKGSVASLADLAENFGVVVLAPDSRSSTWDRIESGFGPDVRFIDYALKHTFQMCAIDPLRLAIAGFSDGASYSLTMGLINGDLFSHVIAFSPGFMTPSELHGQPRIFISHGALDRVLDIDHCSRRIVNKMRAQGFDVDYREFEDGHSIPDRIAHEAIEWFVRYPV